MLIVDDDPLAQPIPIPNLQQNPHRFPKSQSDRYAPSHQDNGVGYLELREQDSVHLSKLKHYFKAATLFWEEVALLDTAARVYICLINFLPVRAFNAVVAQLVVDIS